MPKTAKPVCRTGKAKVAHHKEKVQKAKVKVHGGKKVAVVKGHAKRGHAKVVRRPEAKHSSKAKGGKRVVHRKPSKGCV